jgi:hypothetical protein
MKIHYHLHHIVPKHAGGKDSLENLVRVNKAMHAFLHRLRYHETGDYFDLCAANLLSGDWTSEQARRNAAAEGCRRSPLVKSNAIKNWQDYNKTERHRETSKQGSLNQSKEDKAKGGKIVGSMPYWNNGLNNKRSHTCPGEGYVPGKLPHGPIRHPTRKCPHCELVTSPGALAQHLKCKH